MRTKTAWPLVIEYAVDADGAASDGKAYRALVRNRAQTGVPERWGAWLEGKRRAAGRRQS